MPMLLRNIWQDMVTWVEGCDKLIDRAIRLQELVERRAGAASRDMLVDDDVGFAFLLMLTLYLEYNLVVVQIRIVWVCVYILLQDRFQVEVSRNNGKNISKSHDAILTSWF